MSSVTYVAKRKLIAGHTLNTEYTINFAVQEALPSDKEISNSTVSLGGVEESNFIRIEEYFQITTAPLSGYDAFQEFLYSVAGRAVFQIDPYYDSTHGSYAPFDAYMTAKSQPVRFKRGSSWLWVFSFTVRKVAVVT